MLAAALLGASCKREAELRPSGPPRAAAVPPVVEPIYQGGLKSGWEDSGWSERRLAPDGAQVRMSDYGGWSLAKRGQEGTIGGLTLRMKAPAGFENFLEVRLDSLDERVFPRVQVSERHVVDREGEWQRLYIPVEELNPDAASFDKIVLRAHTPVDPDWVVFQDLGLTGMGGGAGWPATGTATTAQAPRMPPVVEPVYQGGLKSGWEDSGWSERELTSAGAQVRMSSYGGWALTKPGQEGAIGGLTLRMKAPAGFEDFLEVRLDSLDERVFPRVKVAGRHLMGQEGEWQRLYIPVEELNPRADPFNKIVLRAHASVDQDWVFFDDIGLTAADTGRVAALAVGGARASRGATRPASLAVLCEGPGHRISPLIYGIAFDSQREHQDTHQWTLGATARRWGGNPTSRYNWKLGNAWNTGEDWYYRNVVLAPGDPAYTYESFLRANQKRGLKSALTLPIIGWVAKDTTSVSFPVSRFGPQQQTAPEMPEAGNGLSERGEMLKPPPPTETSVPAPPEFIAEWVGEIRRRHPGAVHMYILDNEPTLWNSTHRDVHPEPTTYDELLERTVAYASAVRKADSKAVIAGPAEWGWNGYFYSAADMAPGGNRRDYKAHGEVPLLPWYLGKLRDHEKQTGARLLDVVDVHFYPESKVGIGEAGGTDLASSALRIRSTRALWDPTYRDESWIGTEVRLIPRVKEWIAQSYPGRGLSIGEYSFGATGHMSGGLAQAEALGRFAQQDVLAAFHWTYPPDRSPAYWAFRAFRNFDGKGGRFQDVHVPTEAAPGTSLFASRDDSGARVVAIALNLEADLERKARLELKGCPGLSGAQAFQYVGEPSGFSPGKIEGQGPGWLEVTMPPWSITVLDLTLGKKT
jgi:hypothetical protein